MNTIVGHRGDNETYLSSTGHVTKDLYEKPSPLPSKSIPHLIKRSIVRLGLRGLG